MNYSKYNSENLVAARRIFITAAFVLFAMFRIMPLAAAPRVSEQRQTLITYALKLQGTPYVYGGDSPENGMDCSGFVTYVAANSVGVQLPRTAHSLYTATKRIKPQEREPGDLVFFKNDPASERITHVGIYCGVYHGKNRAFEGRRVFVSAVSDGPKTGVQLTLMSQKFWKGHFFAYGRFLPSTKEYNAAVKIKNEAAK